jgi:hypothetical protein
MFERLVAGLASASWSMLVAVAMPFFGRTFDQGRYATAFAAAAGAPLVGFLAWWVSSGWGSERRGGGRSSIDENGLPAGVRHRAPAALTVTAASF